MSGNIDHIPRIVGCIGKSETEDADESPDVREDDAIRAVKCEDLSGKKEKISQQPMIRPHVEWGVSEGFII